MADPRLDRAMYRQIADELRDEIRTGALAEGDPLPSTQALVDRFSVAQNTVRKALEVLRAEGLLESRTGLGVFVKRERPVIRVANDRFLRQNRLGRQGKGAFTVELERQGMAPKSETTVTGPVVPPHDVTVLLGLEDDATVVARERRMLADGEPIQLATSWVPWSLAEGTPIAVEDSGPGGIYARIEELGHELAEFQEEVGARPATPEEANALRIDAGAPIIILTRVAYDTSGTPVEVCRHTMNATRYRLTYRFPAA